MSHKKITLLITGLLTFSLISNDLNAQKIIKIKGSSTVQPIATIAARVYGKKYNIRIIVEGGGSSKGVEDTGEGLVDIGTVSRNIYPEEKKRYPDLISHTIAYDGIA